VNPQILLDRALELAEMIAQGSPVAIGGSLKAVWKSYELPLTEAYASGIEILIRHRAHYDAVDPRSFHQNA